MYNKYNKWVNSKFSQMLPCQFPAQHGRSVSLFSPSSLPNPCGRLRFLRGLRWRFTTEKLTALKRSKDQPKGSTMNFLETEAINQTFVSRWSVWFVRP